MDAGDPYRSLEVTPTIKHLLGDREMQMNDQQRRYKSEGYGFESHLHYSSHEITNENCFQYLCFGNIGDLPLSNGGSCNGRLPGERGRAL